MSLWCNVKTQNPGMTVGATKDQLHKGSYAAMSVRYTATLGVREETVLFVSGLLHAERGNRGTRIGTRALNLESALLAAKAAGYHHVNVDRTLIETDRCAAPGPTPGVDLWWSGNCAARRCHFGWR